MMLCNLPWEKKKRTSWDRESRKRQRQEAGERPPGSLREGVLGALQTGANEVLVPKALAGWCRHSLLQAAEIC